MCKEEKGYLDYGNSGMKIQHRGAMACGGKGTFSESRISCPIRHKNDELKQFMPE